MVDLQRSGLKFKSLFPKESGSTLPSQLYRYESEITVFMNMIQLAA